MAFAFSITALAEDEEEVIEVEILYPVDPGYNEDTNNYDNLDLKLDPTPENPNIESGIWGIEDEWFEDAWADIYEDFCLEAGEGYINSDAYDEKVVFDAIQFIAGTWVQENDEGVSGVGGWITVTNYFLGYDTIKAILQWFEDDEFFLITNFEYDAKTGTLKFYVDDLGAWSYFFALIQRGVPPAQAAKVLSGTSPQTSDNSIHGGIILLLTLSAATGTVVISKKARNHN